MDREQEELQFLGFFGIYKESYKIIYSWRKMFSKIALSLILPLSFILLAHILVSELLFSKIMFNESALDHTKEDSNRYYRISDHLSWTTFWLFEAAYIIFSLIFSLLSTSAIFYTVACIYTAKEITFKKVMSVVPKVWKRLMVTFLCNFVILFGYNFLSIFIIIIFALLFGIGSSTAGKVVLGLLLLIYVIGLFYITVVWSLSNVISVLEDKCGFQAMMKSKELIKGKFFVAFTISLPLQISYILMKTTFDKFVVYGDSFSMVIRVGFGILCLVLLLKILLFGHVIQTIIYFVCKSYHHENIDKSCLADHLEVYLGEYAPLKTKDLQLEQFYV